MEFLEIEESIVSENRDMAKPHSHEYYELYFLFEGQREFFIDNKMFIIGANSLVVVPPFSIHKTEGGPYKRINVNISENFLGNRQAEFLKRTSEKTAVRLSKEQTAIIYPLLKKGVEVQKSALPFKKECLLSFARAAIYLLSLEKTATIPTASNSSLQSARTDSMPETLKIIYYINENYSHALTLKDICDEFYMSKVTLCKTFKNVMRCSVMKYVQGLRINKAKELLINSDKSVEEVSRLCGFSSANYFGLTFKKETGMSPFNYKKSK